MQSVFELVSCKPVRYGDTFDFLSFFSFFDEPQKLKGCKSSKNVQEIVSPTLALNEALFVLHLKKKISIKRRSFHLEVRSIASV